MLRGKPGARLLLLVVLVVFTSEAARGNLPRDPEGDLTDEVWRPLQLSLLGLLAIGLAISLRSLAIAAAIVSIDRSAPRRRTRASRIRNPSVIGQLAEPSAASEPAMATQPSDG